MFDVGALDWIGILGGLTSLLVVFYLQGHQRIIKSRGTQISTIAFALLVAYIWAPFGFPNSEWARAPLGTDVVRIIPFIQFDPALLKTAWLPMQILIGGTTYFLAALALYGDARRALFAVIGIMAIGGGDVGALQLGNDPFDRTARRELHDQEADRHDADHRRDDQQDPPQDICAHASSLSGLADGRRDVVIKVAFRIDLIEQVSIVRADVRYQS